jgi:hypothetical protein
MTQYLSQSLSLLVVSYAVMEDKIGEMGRLRPASQPAFSFTALSSILKKFLIAGSLFSTF